MTAGAVSGALSAAGIGDDFIGELADELQPNTSVLFVLIRRATPDKVVDEIKLFGGTVLQSSLSHDSEATLQTTLDEAMAATA